MSSSQIKKNEKYKLMARDKRARLQAQVFSGELMPTRWKTCAQCGRIYPFYNRYLQHEDGATCPKWLTDSNCGDKYRGARISASSDLLSTRYKPKKQDCRAELCHKPPICAHIDNCLDIEIEKPGSLPLKTDGSCKEPLRLKVKNRPAMRYGIGSSYNI